MNADASRDARGEALAEIAAERQRQVTEEGWSTEHDDQHEDGELAMAAAAYAWVGAFPEEERARAIESFSTTPRGTVSIIQTLWPVGWDADWLKPKNPRRDLIRAAALIVAEIERLDRASDAEARRRPE